MAVVVVLRLDGRLYRVLRSIAGDEGRAVEELICDLVAEALVERGYVVVGAGG